MGAGGLGCGATLMKYILFVFNFLFFLSGAGILGVSIWLMVDSKAQGYLDFINYDDGSNLMEVTLIVLTTVGAFIFLVGFLGCCGACKESSCMLCTYAFLLGIVVVAQITAAILAIVFKFEVEKEVTKQFDKVADQMTTTWGDSYTRLVNRIQIDLKCCGGSDFKVYKGGKVYGDKATGTPLMYVPPSCCKRTEGAKVDLDKPASGVVNAQGCYDEAKDNWGSTNPTLQFLHATGCTKKLKSWVEEKAIIVIGVAFGLVLFQMICILFAFCVRKNINEGY